MIDPDLAGKAALITGANNPVGIGAAIALALAHQGVSIFLTAHRESPEGYGIDPSSAGAAREPGEAFYRARNADPLDVIAAQVRACGVPVAHAEIDLADPASAAHLMTRAEMETGPIEILVNNAAHSTSDTFLPATDIDWVSRHLVTLDAASHDSHFAVNSCAVALLMAEFARRHIARGATWGRIVNISTDGADCFPGEVSYGASKAALEAYSRSAAQELGRFGVTVNLVAPGPIQTGWIPREAERGIVATIPLGRLGEPSDVADVVVFLASDQARWITGQRIWVGGGHRM
jgi:3-oxoacyl-[acyl-carrier protein] reductase